MYCNEKRLTPMDWNTHMRCDEVRGLDFSLLSTIIIQLLKMQVQFNNAGFNQFNLNN